MQLLPLSTRQHKRQFVEFIYSVYKGDKHFVDTSMFFVKTFLWGTDSFAASCNVLPVVVRVHGQTVAQCMFIAHNDFPYLQMSFFDALPHHQEAVNLLLAHAGTEAKRYGKTKVVIGLNGHVSYGVGILTSGFDKKISFDSLYNKEYYVTYFESLHLERHTLTTYAFALSSITGQLPPISRIYKNFSFRTLDMRRFKEEMLLFGALCNTCLHDTFLYFDRDPMQMYELMSGIKLFLRPENLIFALKDGKEVGFVLWHPDYNEVLAPGVKNSLVKIAFRYFTRGSRISTVKVNAIGIIPECQKTGAVAGLFREGLLYAKKKFSLGETNFVWDNNKKSSLLNHGLSNIEDRKYSVYVTSI